MFFNDENEFNIYSDISNDNIDDNDPYAFDNDPYSFGDEESTENDENVDYELEKQIAEEKHKMEMARLEAQRKSRERLVQLSRGEFSSSAVTTPTSSFDSAPVSSFDTGLDTSNSVEDFAVSNPYVFDDNFVIPTNVQRGSNTNASGDIQQTKVKPVVVEKYLVKKVVQTNKLTVIFSWLISFGITAGLAIVLLAYFGVDPTKAAGLAPQFSFLENDIWWISIGAVVGLLLALLVTMIITVVLLHKKTTIINVTIKEKAEQMAAKEELVKKAREEAIRRYKIEKAKRVVAEHQRKKNNIEKSKKDVVSTVIKKITFDNNEINGYEPKISDFEKLVISPRIIQDGNKLNVLKNYNNVFINQFKLISSPLVENKELEKNANKMHELLQIKNNVNLKSISPFYLYEVANVQTGLSLSTWELDSENIKQILITKPLVIKNNFLITNADIPVSNEFVSELFSEKFSYENKQDDKDMNLVIYSNNSEIKNDLKQVISHFSDYLVKSPETQILILDGICYISSIVPIGFMEPEFEEKTPEEIKKLLIDQIKTDAKFFKRLNKAI